MSLLNVGARALMAFQYRATEEGWPTAEAHAGAMLMAGEIKLKVSGREVTAAGQQAIDALKTNNSFKQIGVSLRDERPSIETLGRAAERLTELVGDMVIPLEQEISKAAAKHFPRFQHDYGSLAEKLTGLGLAGSDRVRTLNQDIADVLASGIDVHTTLNVQHVESVVDLVEEATGIRVRETVPDTVLQGADEIELIDLVAAPLGGRKLYFTSPGEAFFIQVKLAFVVGVVLAMPIILFQLWRFIAPGLTPEERRLARPWLPVALLFFASILAHELADALAEATPLRLVLRMLVLPEAVSLSLAVDHCLAAHLAQQLGLLGR